MLQWSGGLCEAQSSEAAMQLVSILLYGSSSTVVALPAVDMLVPHHHILLF
jgi:hypothetical protein